MTLNYHEALINIRKELKDYIKKYNLRSLVLGISGGIDSALCAALAAPVCAEVEIPLIGRSITIESNSEGEIRRAAAVGETFCRDFLEVDLSELYLSYLPEIDREGKDNPEDFSVKLRRGNIKARVRMIYLYDLAARNHGLVLSTDNKTEEMVGFWTLHGDVGDYGMIQKLWKTEVYELAEVITAELSKNSRETADALRSCIEAVPTDGLGITDSDLEQLRVTSYREADRLLRKYIEEGDKSNEDHPVIQRHLKTSYKRNNPFNIRREKIFTSGRTS